MDAAEAVGCGEALNYDYEDLLAEAKDAYKPETVAEWKEKNEVAKYILKKIFSAKGKALNIVSNHKKKTGRDTCRGHTQSVERAETSVQCRKCSRSNRSTGWKQKP